jgi:hypothetical protein
MTTPDPSADVGDGHAFTGPAAMPGSSKPHLCPVCASAGRPMFPLHTWSTAAVPVAPTARPAGRSSSTGVGGGAAGAGRAEG